MLSVHVLLGCKLNAQLHLSEPQAVYITCLYVLPLYCLVAGNPSRGGIVSLYIEILCWYLLAARRLQNEEQADFAVVRQALQPHRAVKQHAVYEIIFKYWRPVLKNVKECQKRKPISLITVQVLA